MIVYQSKDSTLFKNEPIEFYFTDCLEGKIQNKNAKIDFDFNINADFFDENLKYLSDRMNILNISYLKQTHSDIIVPLKLDSSRYLGEGDGIICKTPNLYAMVFMADCNPVLLYTRHCFVLIHAGRRGLEQNIITKGVTLLKRYIKKIHTLNTASQTTNISKTHIFKSTDSASITLDSAYDKSLVAPSIIAFIGPSIRKCCYEINGDLLRIYRQKYADFLCYKDGRFYLDMTAMIVRELKNNNIYHFEIYPQCTCCNDRFFSYRRDKTTKRMAFIAGLKSL